MSKPNEFQVDYTMVYIPIDLIHPHPDNPRKDLGDLTELAASIKAKGILQNLTVVPHDGEYRTIIGHRRHAAAKLAGITEVPCVIADMTPQEQFETMMVENMQRSDLTPYEQAEGFQMMLDMGGTVEQVAKKTGFSETTVRNRVKLLRLDKKKFHEAQERGGTMSDYLRLNAIEDPKLRNKVLATVGTADFENTLKATKAEEEARALIVKFKAEMEAADWCEKIDPNTVRHHGNYRYVRNISRWNPDTSKPEDADTEKYVWQLSSTGKEIYLYRENHAEDAKAADPMAEKKKILNDALNQIDKELDNISQRHIEMRMDFIAKFGAFTSSELDITTFATKAFMYIADNSISIDPDRLGNLLGVPVTDDELDPAAWNRELYNRPQRVLLCTAYIALECDGRKYNYQVYDRNIGASVPEPKKKTATLALDLIYDCLKSLDYEMSEEEKQMKDGTHPLYQRAKTLVADFVREKEAANG